MEGSSFTGEPKEYVKEGTGNRHLSHLPFGEPGGGSFTRDFDIQ